MKFNCRKRELNRIYKRQQEWERITQWHKVFAWRPIEVEYGDCRWLEWVERRNRRSDNPKSLDYYHARFMNGAADFVTWEYRSLK